MTVNLALLRPCLEVILNPAWWYNRLVEHYAEAFWLANGGNLFIRTIATMLEGIRTAPGHAVVRRRQSPRLSAGGQLRTRG
ncbi:hypothetical protein [Dactylosporangium sp. CA-092794]|uniref:hypothetical protein n=1 Tax=Dactylosporangium sp. CA-092794 TaxID=3239929 RepID=UPI003D89E7C9